MNYKSGIIFGLLFGLVFRAISYIFAEPKNPTANEYIKMKVKIKMLEKQNRLLHEGWDTCVQDYERLMEDCAQVCKI